MFQCHYYLAWMEMIKKVTILERNQYVINEKELCIEFLIFSQIFTLLFPNNKTQHGLPSYKENKELEIIKNVHSRIKKQKQSYQRQKKKTYTTEQ